MANFLKAEEITGASEGGYVHDPLDRGGETYFGIARKHWPDWKGWFYVDLCKQHPGFPGNMDHKAMRPHVLEFFKVNFWDTIEGDAIEDQDIANVLYDIAVNMGVGRAVKFLQTILNLLNRGGKDYPDISVDGGMGDETLKALKLYFSKGNIQKKYRLLFFLMVKQGALWVDLASRDPSQERFMNGWGNRAISNIKHITDNYYGIRS